MRRKPIKTRMLADDVVTANGLATPRICTRQNIARLTAEAVIEQRTDGGYDQTASRLKLHQTFEIGASEVGSLGGRRRFSAGEGRADSAARCRKAARADAGRRPQLAARQFLPASC